jgi:hypothetical protein
VAVALGAVAVALGAVAVALGAVAVALGAVARDAVGPGVAAVAGVHPGKGAAPTAAPPPVATKVGRPVVVVLPPVVTKAGRPVVVVLPPVATQAGRPVEDREGAAGPAVQVLLGAWGASAPPVLAPVAMPTCRPGVAGAPVRG